MLGILCELSGKVHQHYMPKNYQ